MHVYRPLYRQGYMYAHMPTHMSVRICAYTFMYTCLCACLYACLYTGHAARRAGLSFRSLCQARRHLDFVALNVCIASTDFSESVLLLAVGSCCQSTAFWPGLRRHDLDGQQADFTHLTSPSLPRGQCAVLHQEPF